MLYVYIMLYIKQKNALTIINKLYYNLKIILLSYYMHSMKFLFHSNNILWQKQWKSNIFCLLCKLWGYAWQNSIPKKKKCTHTEIMRSNGLLQHTKGIMMVYNRSIVIIFVILSSLLSHSRYGTDENCE